MSRRALYTNWSRRSTLSTSLLGLTSCDKSITVARPNISFVGQDPQLGHRVREGVSRPRPPARTVKTPLLIVGAGAAGASAAYWAKRHGLTDFHLIDLEAHAGGTARSAESEYGSFPLGAHYLPEPPPHCITLVSALTDIGFSRVLPGSTSPDYDPMRVAPAPLERHLYKGYWHEGLYPAAGSTPRESDQWQRFRDHLREFRVRGFRGTCPDGTSSLFALPLARSHPSVASLDRIDAQTYLFDRGIDSWRVHWMVDYACRDDFGLTSKQCSALAMLHHFLARNDDDAVHERFLLTGPRGNHDLIDGLLDAHHARRHLALGQMAVAVRPDVGEVDVLDVHRDELIRYQAQHILWASPYFVLHAMCRDLPPPAMTYTPWLVAGVSVRARPGGPGEELAWDNVAIEAEHLGYVVADHGAPLNRRQVGATLAFYEPHLADEEQLATVRRSMLQTNLQGHAARILGHLERMHPGLASSIETVRIARWGHAMVRPLAGRLLSRELADCRRTFGRLRCCHTDTTGLPLFEEAFYSGILACQEQLERLGLPGGTIA